MAGASRPPTPWAKRLLVGNLRWWLLPNVFLLRPLCSSLNFQAFSGWRCPVSERWARENPGLNTTGLEVIVAGLGKDGTTSMQVALHAMGLRTYSAHEITFYMRDMLEEGVTAADMVGPMRQCGVQAVLPQGMTRLLPPLVEASPDAKVVLMKREWRSWSRAMSGAEGVSNNTATLAGIYLVVLLPMLCHWFPHKLLLPDADRHAAFIGGGLNSWLIKTCVYLDDRDSFQALEAKRLREGALVNQTEYDDFQEEVRALVPPHRLLEFDVKRHGWAELAEFLGRPAPPPGTPFPRTMSGTLIMQTAMYAVSPESFGAFLALMTAALAANVGAFAAVKRLFPRPAASASDGACKLE